MDSGVNASQTLGGQPSPSLLPFSPPLLSPPSLPLLALPLPSLPTSPLEVGPLNPARGSGGALLAPPAGSGAEPQPKSNLVHFSFKIRHLVAKILMILVKSQLTEKQVVYIVKTIFTIMEVSLLSPDTSIFAALQFYKRIRLGLHVHNDNRRKHRHITHITFYVKLY